MLKIETYKDHEIIYFEDKDLWTAAGLEAKSLKALRAKINKRDAELRRIEPMKAILWERWREEVSEVEILLIADIPVHRRAEVWVMKNGRRTKVDLSELYPDTPEVRKAIERNQKLMKDVDTLRAEMAEIRERTASFKLADLQGRSGETTEEIACSGLS